MLTRICRRVDTVNRFFVEAHIADLHFGVLDPALQFNILKEQFLIKIEAMEVLDIVSINGDIFEHKFMANSDAIMYACYFIEALVDICRRKNATLIIIGGTASHDGDQLKLFYPYVGNTMVDVRIVEEVRFEYIKGKRVLIIPELYGKRKDYYEEFLFNSGFYDAVYMHGAFVGAVYGKDVPDLDSHREPVFCMNHFVNCKGPIMSGHRHTPGCFDVYFYYSGTPIRDKFGEEEDKGFMILLQNIESRKHFVHFEPIISFRYDTINIDDIIDNDPKDVILYIKNLQSTGIHNIRVQLTRNNENNLNIIRTYFRNNGTIKIDANFKNNKVMHDIQELKDKYKEFEYIHQGTNTFGNLSRYINDNEGYMFMSAEELETFIKNL